MRRARSAILKRTIPKAVEAEVAISPGRMIER